MASQKTLFGERLLDITSDIVRDFVKRYDPPRIYVFFSGGKDSAASLASVVYAGDSVVKRVHVVYNTLVGNTHSINVEQSRKILESLGFTEFETIDSPPYVRVTAAIHRGVRVLHIRARSRHGEDFWQSVKRWGIPVKLASGHRWCYNEFKEKHWDRLPATNSYRYVVVGVKITDSHWRRKRWQGSINNVKAFRMKSRGVTSIQLSPILRLTSEQVWWLLEEAGLKQHLGSYEMCGDSLNCTFCPFRSTSKQLRVLRCALRIGNGPEIARRAQQALQSLRTTKDTLTRRKANEWLQQIQETLQQK